MPNFDPAQPLPGESDPIVTPVTPNQVGGIVGTPTQGGVPILPPAYAPGTAVDQQALAAAPAAPNAPPGVAFAPPAVPATPVAPIPPVDPGAAAGVPGTTTTTTTSTAPTPPATGVVPPLPPAAPPTPSQVRAPGPGGGAAPAAPAAAPGAATLTAFDAAAKKEQDAKDAVYKADQQTLDATAAQTTKNNADRLQQFQDQKAERAAQQIKTDAAEKAASVPFHEFQLSTGRTILSALGMILGGFSYDPHHVNQAVTIYQDAIKQDFEKQKADHDNLWKTAQKEVDAGRQLSADQLQEMKEYEIQRAEKLSAILEKGKSLAAFSKNELGKAELEKTNVGLRQSIEDAARNAGRLDAQLNLATAAQHETVRHNKVEEGNQRITAEAAAKNAGNGQASREDVEADREIGNINKKFQTAKKIETDYDEAHKAVQLLKSGNPEEIQLGKDSLIRAATGGKITKYTDIAGMQSTGGISVQLGNALSKFFSGKPDAQAIKVLTDAAAHQEKIALGLARVVNEQGHKQVISNPNLQRIAKTREPGWLENLSRSNPAVNVGEEAPAATNAGPAEGTQSVDTKGRNVVFRGGKWGPA